MSRDYVLTNHDRASRAKWSSGCYSQSWILKFKEIPYAENSAIWLLNVREIHWMENIIPLIGSYISLFHLLFVINNKSLMLSLYYTPIAIIQESGDSFRWYSIYNSCYDNFLRLSDFLYSRTSFQCLVSITNIAKLESMS